MYYIKTKYSEQNMYYVGRGYWAKKDSLFHSPKKYSLKEAKKLLARLHDEDYNTSYELEEVV